MECNLVLEKDPDNNTVYLAGKRGQQSRQLCSHTALQYAFGVLLVLTCVLLVSNIFLHFKYIQLWNKVERQSRIIEQMQSGDVNGQNDPTIETSMKLIKRDYESGQRSDRGTQSESYQQRTQRNKRRHSRRRSHKRRDVSRSFLNQLQQIKTNVNNSLSDIKGLLLKPIVHLKARGVNDRHAVYSESIPDACRSRKCFTWHDPDVDFRNNFEYIVDTSGTERLVTGVKILTTGYYQVYSQIVVNGIGSSSGMTPEVGYETVKLSQGSTVKILLESYITQDRRGRMYPDVRSFSGEGLYAFDTLNHQGIFKLNCGDILIIRPKLESLTAKFSPHETKSYFGVTMINYDTRIIMYGDYACS